MPAAAPARPHPQRRDARENRERILVAARAVFADHGLKAGVDQIAACAGVGTGTLYRHFPSKEALLSTALERHLDDTGSAVLSAAEGDVGDVRTEALVAGRWLLAELDRERAIVRILEQDGDRLAELRDSFRERLVDAGYVAATALARRWLGGGAGSHDIEAITVVLMGGLVNYRRSTWTFGAAPLAIDEARFLSAWADMCAAATSAARRERA